MRVTEGMLISFTGNMTSCLYVFFDEPAQSQNKFGIQCYNTRFANRVIEAKQSKDFYRWLLEG